MAQEDSLSLESGGCAKVTLHLNNTGLFVTARRLAQQQGCLLNNKSDWHHWTLYIAPTAGVTLPRGSGLLHCEHLFASYK
jgi:hypothetical protein